MPLTSSSVYQPPAEAFAKFPSRRSVVHSTEAIVACTQPLAAQCGLEILRAGGNAAVSFSPFCLSLSPSLSLWGPRTLQSSLTWEARTPP